MLSGQCILHANSRRPVAAAAAAAQLVFAEAFKPGAVMKWTFTRFRDRVRHHSHSTIIRYMSLSSSKSLGSHLLQIDKCTACNMRRYRHLCRYTMYTYIYIDTYVCIIIYIYMYMICTVVQCVCVCCC